MEIFRFVHERAVVIDVDKGVFEEGSNGGRVVACFGLVPGAFELYELGFIVGRFRIAMDECNSSERQSGQEKGPGFFHEIVPPELG